MNKTVTIFVLALMLNSASLNAIKFPFIVIKAAKQDAKKLVKNTDHATATAVAYTAFGLGLASHVAGIAHGINNSIPNRVQDFSVAKKVFFGVAAVAQGIRLIKR